MSGIESASLRRPAVVREVAPGRVRLDAQGAGCEGCGGCRGRCALPMGAGTTDWVATTLPLQPGEAVMLTVSANALRHAAMRGYGLIALAAVVGAAVGSVAGDRWHAANAGAALGLWLGTLLAARWTKRHPLPVSVQRMDAR